MVVVTIQDIGWLRCRVAHMQPNLGVLRANRREPIFKWSLTPVTKPEHRMHFALLSRLHDCFEHAQQRSYTNAGAQQDDRLRSRGIYQERARRGASLQHVAHKDVLVKMIAATAWKFGRLIRLRRNSLHGDTEIILPRAI